jgi:NADH:ubiquinone oxidoreductase subunit 2 (subunit N)
MCFDFFDQARFEAFEVRVLILLSPCGLLFLISAYDVIALGLAVELHWLGVFVLAASRSWSVCGSGAGVLCWL